MTRTCLPEAMTLAVALLLTALAMTAPSRSGAAAQARPAASAASLPL